MADIWSVCTAVFLPEATPMTSFCRMDTLENQHPISNCSQWSLCSGRVAFSMSEHKSTVEEITALILHVLVRQSVRFLFFCSDCCVEQKKNATCVPGLSKLVTNCRVALKTCSLLLQCRRERAFSIALSNSQWKHMQVLLMLNSTPTSKTCKCIHSRAP